MSGVGTKERLVSADECGPKDMVVSRLWDVYAPLLRQSVSDCLAKCRRLLESYEEKLGMLSQLEKFSKERARASSFVAGWTERMRAEHPEWSGELSSLEEAFENPRED